MNIFQKAKAYLAKEEFEIFREIILSIIISAIVSASFGYYFNKKIDDRTAQRQFTYDFGRTFFDNSKYRNISTAIEDEYLYKKTATSSGITDYNLDDYLNLIDDIWSYYKDGLISSAVLQDQYEYYLCITYKSNLVRDYRKKLANQGFSEDSSYGFLDDIANELKFADRDCKTL